MTSLVDQATKSIKELIGRGDLPPGAHINIDALSEELCMSQTPIREALRKLVTEGIVSHTPKTGYSVSNLTINEFTQILEILCVLESHIVKELAKKPFLVDFEKLSSINDELRKKLSAFDAVFFRRTNDKFHRTLTENYYNTMMKKHFFALWEWIRPKRDCMYCNSQWGARMVDEHEAIIKAIKEGDVEVAERAVIDHYRSGNDSAMAYYR